MIAFIASPEKLKLFSSEFQTSLELITDTQDIGTIVNRLKYARHYTQIIIDVEYLDNSQKEITSQLYLFKAMNDTNIIIIAQGKDTGDTLLSELVKIGIYNFVLSYDEQRIANEIQACITGVDYETVKHFIIEETTTKKSFFSRKAGAKQHEIISIGIGGICSRIGTSTQSIRLVRSLINNGHKACYVEQNNNKHVAIIKAVFVGAEQENETFFTYNNIPLFYDKTAELNNYDYGICDYGVLNEDNQDKFSQCDIKVVVAGCTAWEMALLSQLQIHDADARYVFSFTGKNEQEEILDFMEEKWTRTYFAEYSPDMFSPLSGIEQQMYDKIILNRKL